jgi:putative transposase
MRVAFLLFVHLIVTIIKLIGPGGVRAVLAESLLVKQQLLITNRSRKRAPNLTESDRFFLGLFSLLIRPHRLGALAVVVSIATLFKFHDALKKRKYRRLFGAHGRRKPGPKGPSQQLINAIVEMKTRNPRFGCPRIAQQLAKAFGVDIDKHVVRRVLEKHYRPLPGGGGGPSWLAAIGHMKDSPWSVDLFRCESILLKSHWVMVVMDQFTRSIIGFGVHVGDVDGPALCRMFNQAIVGAGLPRHLSSDNDPLFKFQQWKANLRILEIDEIKTVAYVPVSHPFVERLIGSIRGEHLNHALFWNAADLESKLRRYQAYFNGQRTHAGIEASTPVEKAGATPAPIANLDHYRWQKHCGGLFELPVAA